MFILQLFKMHLSFWGACEWRVCVIFVRAAISICQSSTITAVTEEITAASVLFPLIATTGWWVRPYYGCIQASSIFLFTSCFFKGPWHNFVRAAIYFSDLWADYVNAFEYYWVLLHLAQSLLEYFFTIVSDAQFLCFWNPKQLCKYMIQCDDKANSMIKLSQDLLLDNVGISILSLLFTCDQTVAILIVVVH